MVKKEYEEIPDGRYMCKFAKCEFGTSKAGWAQLVTWLRIMEGEFMGRYLFYYQSMNNPTGVKIANEVKAKSEKHGVGPNAPGRFEVNVVTKTGKGGREYRNYYINDDKEVWK